MYILQCTIFWCFLSFLVDNASMNWTVYIILCTDNTLYTGITNDVTRRFDQHAAGRGAKYFRGRQPEQLVYIEPGHNRSSATKREIGLKRMSREEKVRIIASDMNKIMECFF
jgi:putative endonuclease